MVKKVLKNPSYMLAIIVFSALIPRFQNFTLLPIDAHAMRQTDTESVAYYYATKNANIFHPEASLIRPITNAQGLFFLEFPTYEYSLGILYRLFGTSLVVARIYNLILFVCTCLLLYRLTTKLFTQTIALWSVFLFAWMPSSLFFLGHAIHPDLFTITCYLVAANLLLMPTSSLWFIVGSGIAMGMAVGMRPFIAMALPSLWYLLWIKKSPLRYYGIITFFSLILYGFWTYWQGFFPEANASWQQWTLAGRDTVFTIPVMRNLLLKNVAGQVLGRIISLLVVIGGIFVAVSSIQKKTRELALIQRILLFTLPWIAAIPLYWYLVPTGNIAHQYYAHVFVIPLIILASFGVVKSIVLLRTSLFQTAAGGVIVILVLYNGLRTSSYYFKDIAHQDNVVVAAELSRVIPHQEKIVLMAPNNSLPLSLSHRQGWMLGASPTDVGGTAREVIDMKQYGARYAVQMMGSQSINDDEIKLLRSQKPVVYQSEHMVVYKL